MLHRPFFSEPTSIITKPKNMKVIRGTDVRFECGVKADATSSVTTTWMKGKRPVTLSWRCIQSLTINTCIFQIKLKTNSPAFFACIPRISLDESNLVITNVNRGDEGYYTCVIKSELEEKSASARLMVMGTCKKEITFFVNHTAC